MLAQLSIAQLCCSQVRFAAQEQHSAGHEAAALHTALLIKDNTAQCTTRAPLMLCTGVQQLYLLMVVQLIDLLYKSNTAVVIAADQAPDIVV